MIVKWEGEAPPDKAEWYELLEAALGEEAGLYRVVFHRGSAGWRFDLEHRSDLKWRGGPLGPPFTKADEDVMLRVRALLAERGKNLAPDGDPEVTALSAPLIPIESTTAPDESAGPPPAPIPEAALGDGAEAAPLPSASSVQPTPPLALRPWWLGLRGARGRWALLGFALAAAWLARGRFRPSAVSTVVPPSGPASSEEPRGKAQATGLPAPGQGKETGERPQEAPSLPPRPPLPTKRASALAPTRATGTPAAPTPDAPGIPTPVPPTSPPSAEEPRSAEPPSAAAAEGPGPLTSPSVERGRVLDVADPGVTRPALLAQEPPHYPPAALRRGIGGSVVLGVIVDETGAVVEASVVRVTPRHMGFEEAATRHVKSRRYLPATKDDVPVRVRMTVVVEFRRGGSR